MVILLLPESHPVLKMERLHILTYFAEGREAYRRRQGIVESYHGHDQKNLGWRQHRLRGLPKATLEFQLLRLAGNIGKIARYKARELLALAGGVPGYAGA